MTAPRPLPIFQLPLGEGVAHYLDTRASAPALLLLHGAPGRPQDFRFMVPHLAGKLRVIAPGMPGQGLTPLAAEPGTSLTARVAFLTRFIDALGLESVLIGGHSMGGALAIALAAALGPRARGLVLMASFGLSPHRGLRRSRPALAAALLGSPLRPLLTPAL
ncbi:MAG: pimeloyl-ACP methyl ester carboxylesterase, partial [Myxococcota bacterium]